ncbi:MAG: hypothetical protein AAF960_17465, partial [Bacteroidota bacterium]
MKILVRLSVVPHPLQRKLNFFIFCSAASPPHRRDFKGEDFFILPRENEKYTPGKKRQCGGGAAEQKKNKFN